MSSIAMLLGRILLSAIFIEAGLSKLIHLGATVAYFESVGLPFPSLVVWPVIALELVGGLAVLFGFQILIAATALGVFALAAALIGHGDFSNITHFQAFMKDLAIAGGLFYAASQGAGLISLDARRGV